MERISVPFSLNVRAHLGILDFLVVVEDFFGGFLSVFHCIVFLDNT